MFTLTSINFEERNTERASLKGAPNGTSSVEELLKEYVLSIGEVSGYALALGRTDLCSFTTAPTWFTAEFTKKFSQSKSEVLVWTNSILPNMIAVPQTIVDYNLLFQIKKETILEYAQKLSLAYDQKCQDTLVESVASLETTIGNIVASIDSLINSIKKFHTGLVANAAFIKTTCNNINKSQKESKEAIKQLEADLKSLQDEVDKLNKEISKLEISAIATGSIAAVSFFFLPLLSFVCAFACVGVVVADLVKNAELRVKQAQVTSTTSTLSSANIDLASLNVLSNSFDHLCELSERSIISMQTIQKVWLCLRDSVGSVLQEIKDAGESADKKLYKNIIESITASDEAWEKLVASAQLLIDNNMKVEKDVYVVKTA